MVAETPRSLKFQSCAKTASSSTAQHREAWTADYFCPICEKIFQIADELLTTCHTGHLFRRSALLAKIEAGNPHQHILKYFCVCRCFGAVEQAKCGDLWEFWNVSALFLLGIRNSRTVSYPLLSEVRGSKSIKGVRKVYSFSVGF